MVADIKNLLFFGTNLGEGFGVYLATRCTVLSNEAGHRFTGHLLYIQMENLKNRKFVPLVDYITNLIFFDPYIREGHGGFRVPDLSGSR